MATDFANILFDNVSDATFRAWGLRFSQALAAIGLVKTADTGQIDWTTAVRPSGQGENITGYEMYRFNDALQATKPVFIKFEYGVSNNSVTSGFHYLQPVIFFTVGTAANGSGTLTGQVGTRARLLGNPNVTSVSVAAQQSAVSTSSPCYFQGDTSSIVLALGVTSSAQPTLTQSNGGYTTSPGLPAFLLIERTRNADGTPNGDGVVTAAVRWTINSWQGTGATQSSVHQTISFLGTYGPGPQDAYWPVVWPGAGFGTGNFGGDVYFLPLLTATPKAEYQCLSVLGTWKNDVPLAATMVVPVLGANHTYLSLAGIGGTANADNTRSYVNATTPLGALMMRYE